MPSTGTLGITDNSSRTWARLKQAESTTVLEAFIADRLATGVTVTTINRSLEVVRTILNGAARAYRDDNGRPWLDGLPPLVTILRQTAADVKQSNAHLTGSQLQALIDEAVASCAEKYRHPRARADPRKTRRR